MPTFDGGHYFLTALVPIETDLVADTGGILTSPVHAMRKALAQLPATPTIYFETKPSPFARSRELHFARFVIIDDVAYNGRISGDTLLTKVAARGYPRLGNPVLPQTQDHLSRPYLLISIDFDAADGSASTRDALLRRLWDVAGPTLADIFQYAVGFDETGTTADTFAAYIAKCQIETTMSFNDYYIEPLKSVDWPRRPSTKPYLIAGAVGALACVLGAAELLIAFVALIFSVSWSGLALTGAILLVVGIAVLAGAIYAALGNLTAAGEMPFPTAADTSLPSVLKALHLQRAFTDFAIANQGSAATTGAKSDEALHAAFEAFLAANDPSNLDVHTQQPGVLGI